MLIRRPHVSSVLLTASLAAMLAFAGPCMAANEAPPATKPAPLDDAAALAIAQDPVHRMTVPVMVDGKGPFDFVVDTGSDRTVISAELAATLGLKSGPRMLVRGSSGVHMAASVRLDSLSVGSRIVPDVAAPVLPRAWIGADGMLGVDAVRDQAMNIDFLARKMSIRAIRPDAVDPAAIVVSGRNRYGQLILLDANIQGQNVFVILDTGTETTIVNSRFRDDFADDGAFGHADAVRVLSVVGGHSPGHFASVPELTLGDLTLRNLPVVISDLYTFDLFQLRNKPAMLLGMNILREFSRVDIDYRHHKVAFTLGSRAMRESPLAHFMSQSVNQ